MLHLMCALHTLGVKNMEALGQRRHDDRGQTAAEYLGIIVVVVAIVAAIAGSDIGGDIKSAIQSQITKITGGAGAGN